MEAHCSTLEAKEEAIPCIKRLKIDGQQGYLKAQYLNLNQKGEYTYPRPTQFCERQLADDKA